MERIFVDIRGGESSVKEEVDQVLGAMGKDDVFILDGIFSKWGNPVKIGYLRTIISVYSGNNNKKFAVKKRDSSHFSESCGLVINRLK